MLPANRNLLPIVGVDIHIILIPPAAVPTPLPHPFIGMVMDPFDFIPFVGATVNVNNIPRANSTTDGMLGSKVHIPMGGPFATPPLIGHDSKNFFGSPRVVAEGSYFSGAGFMVMSCNCVGLPLTATPGKKGFKPSLSKYLPTSATIPIPGGPPVIVGGPYVPDLMGMVMGLAMSFGLGALMKGAGAALKKLNHSVLKKFKCTKSLSDFLCKHGFEPVNLINGSVLYEGVDFELPGPIPLTWSRRWYSDSGYEGLLGHGTHGRYDQLLEEFPGDQAVGLVLPDGRSTAFPWITEVDGSTYIREEKLTLYKDSGMKYRVFDHNTQLTHHFTRINETQFRMNAITNMRNHFIEFQYNEFNQLHLITDSVGRTVRLKLDSRGRVLKAEAFHDGQQKTLVSYRYNEAGDLASIIDALEQSTDIVFQNHLMVEKTDRNGQRFYWEYDGPRTGARCIHTWGDGGLLEGRIEYLEGYNRVTNGLGETTIYYYDENDLCVEEVDPLGNSTQFEYTQHSELYRVIDAEGRITGYTYDKRGFLNGKELPDGSAVVYVYDEWGRLKIYNNAENGAVVNAYQDGFLKAIIDPDETQTGFDYNEDAMLSVVTNAEGFKTHLEYDQDLNVARITLPNGGVNHYHYDTWGRLTETINAEGQTQQMVYDILDRVTQVKTADNNQILLQYDAYDNVLNFEDQQRAIKFEYNGIGALLKRDEEKAKLHFNYDTQGRLRSLVNEHGEIYRFGLDANGLINTEIGFDGITRRYDRDKAGQVVRIDRPSNKFTEYEYDLNGRIVRSEYHDGTWELFSYDKNGALIEAENETGKVTLKRDAAGRILKDQFNEQWVQSTYGAFGRREKISSSLGAQVQTQYDENGLLQSMQDQSGTGWAMQLLRNKLGQETERSLPAEVKVMMSYDQAGRPMKQQIQGRKETLRSRKYSWGVNDKLQQMVNELSGGTVNYGYDVWGNLSSAIYENGQQDFKSPDKVGNIYRDPSQKDRKYAAGGKLVNDRGTTFQYDDEGNLIKKTEAGGKQWQYQWMANGMLQQVTRPDGREVCFEYDALGRRTAKIFAQKITRWVWDGNKPLHEWKYNVGERPQMVVDELGVVAPDREEPTPDICTWVFDEGSFRPNAKLVNGQAQSIITDYLGTPVEMIDDTGKQTWSVEYDIYGKVRKQEIGSLTDCPFRYQGQYEDEETGLYYNRFRYYDAEHGNYISQDPIKLRSGQPNFYSYVNNTGLLVDIFGLECKVKISEGDGVTHDIVLELKKSDFGEAGQHLDDIANGQIFKINRSGAASNRAESLKGIPTKKGFDRDEVPMAMFEEGGAGASVRYINPSDNRSAGSSIGKALSDYPDGTTVLFKII